MTDAKARGLEAAELPRLSRAATGVFLAGRSDGATMAAWYPLLFDPAHADQLRVIERDGEIASHAGFALRQVRWPGRTAPVACFGAVFTAPALRGAGLATAALADAIALARGRGAGMALISGERPLYARLGFTPAPPPVRLRAPGASPAAALEVRRAGPGDLDALAALYDAEPIAFVRPRRDWERLLAAGVVVFGPGPLWLVRRAGRPVAYLAVHASTKRGPRALEMAGDRGAALAAAGILEPAAEVLVPPYDTAALEAAAAAGWTAAPERFAWMYAAWDPALAGVPAPWYGLNFV